MDGSPTSLTIISPFIDGDFIIPSPIVKITAAYIATGMIRGSRRLGTLQRVATQEDAAYGLDDIYSLYLPSSPRIPTEIHAMSENGSSTAARMSDVQIDGFASEESSPSQWSATVTGSSPRSKKLQAGFAKYRDSPIVHRASRSLSSLRLHPYQSPKNTYIWDPLYSEWTILEKVDIESDSGPDDRAYESVSIAIGHLFSL